MKKFFIVPLIFLFVQITGCSYEVDFKEVNYANITEDFSRVLRHQMTPVGESFLGYLNKTHDEKLFFTVDGKLIDGEVTQYLIDGTLVRRFSMKDGLLDGTSEEYFSNGNLYLRVDFKNGIENGLVELYRSNGNPIRKFNMENGELEGERLIIFLMVKLMGYVTCIIKMDKYPNKRTIQKVKFMVR